MKPRTLVVPVVTVTIVGLLAFGSIDDKVISSRGSLFLNIDADNNEPVNGQIFEIARDTTEGGIGGTPLLTVRDYGFVGIGTSDPTEKLTVDGGGLEVRVADPGSSLFGSKVILSAQTGHPGMTLIRGNGSGGVARRWDTIVETDNSLRVMDSSAGSLPRMAFTTAGNVGIGTTSPQARLHAFAQAPGTNNPAAVFQVGNCGSPCAQEPYTEAARMWNENNNGRVGIGFLVDVDGGISDTPDVWLGTAYGANGENDEFVVAVKQSGVLTESVRVVGNTTRVKVLQILGGADIVEGFDASDDAALEPGTVVVIDPANAGALMASTSPYDTKVAGVVSGAGGISAGIHLGQDSVLDGDTKVAMTGRVYVKCTTSNGPIRPGDRLTTADLAGCAMKATDSARSVGTVIGKAMTSLDEGTGLVLVLVNLQ